MSMLPLAARPFGINIKNTKTQAERLFIVYWKIDKIATKSQKYDTYSLCDPLITVKGGFGVSLDIQEQYDKIYRYCYFKVQDSCLAEDLTQETFLRYFAQTSYIHRGKQLAYLYTIARNLCIDYYRKPKHVPWKEEWEFSGNSWSDQERKMREHPMEQVEGMISLEMAVEKLPREMQELILLRYVNELSIREICRITGLSRSSEYRIEKEALRRLKEILEEGYCGK